MPEPYYEDEWVTLYHGDCREVTEWLDADVLVTDPPYGRSWRSGSGMTNSEGRGLGSKPNGGIAGDETTEVRDAVLEAWGDRIGVVFGDPLIPQPAGARQALVYAKPLDGGIKGARAGFRRDIEMVYLIGDWPVGVGGRTSILHTRGLVAGPTGLSVRYEHPHAKPVDLLESLLGFLFPYRGEQARAVAEAKQRVIADPFAGSGSTLVAARARGHRAIGVELEERYAEIAARRLAQDVLDFEAAP